MQKKVGLMLLALIMVLIQDGLEKLPKISCSRKFRSFIFDIGGKEMLRDIDYILESFHDRPHIFNLGHGITPSTPVENVQIMIDYIRNTLGKKHELRNYKILSYIIGYFMDGRSFIFATSVCISCTSCRLVQCKQKRLKLWNEDY